MADESERAGFHDYIESNLAGLCCPASGWMKHPYITLGAHYGAGGRTFFWDAFFETLRMRRSGFAKEIRGTLECYLDHMDTGTGRVLRILSPDGPMVAPGQDQVQPFLGQLAYVANLSTPLGDDAPRIVDKLAAFLAFWERERGTTLGLYRWLESYESGIDSALAIAMDPPLTVAAVDLSCYLVLDYRAAAALAQEYGMLDRAAGFRARADRIAEAIRTHMWDPRHEVFCNIRMSSGQRIFLTFDDDEFCILPWTNFIPLYAGIATPAQAEATVRRYLLSPEHMLSKYGLRSFSRKSVYYTEQRICPAYSELAAHWLKTGSNWSGPVWTLSNYMLAHGMAQYGFKDEARAIALDVAAVNWRSVQADGGMFENYHPETGKGLWAKGLFSWNILADGLADEVRDGTQPLLPIRRANLE